MISQYWFGTVTHTISNQFTISGIGGYSNDIFLIGLESRYSQLMMMVWNLLSCPEKVVVTKTSLYVTPSSTPGKDSIPGNLEILN